MCLLTSTPNNNVSAKRIVYSLYQEIVAVFLLLRKQNRCECLYRHKYFVWIFLSCFSEIAQLLFLGLFAKYRSVHTNFSPTSVAKLHYPVSVFGFRRYLWSGSTCKWFSHLTCIDDSVTILNIRGHEYRSSTRSIVVHVQPLTTVVSCSNISCLTSC